MPELAEVEFFRKQWDVGLGEPIKEVALHEKSRVFRGCDVSQLREHLTGGKLLSSEAAAKQMVFRTSRGGWLGIHLGMSGTLSAVPAGSASLASDHLVLVQRKRTLIFSDPRMFGRILFSSGATAPGWWTKIAPAIASKGFSVSAVSACLERRKRTAIKPVLLMQEQFPGIGNWMADEILWRAAIHPKRAAGSLTPEQIAALHRETRRVAKQALATIGKTMADPPETWLFPHRWRDGGRCPRTGAKLLREVIGGRMTCWSPARQVLR